jgi:hypothetical protein
MDKSIVLERALCLPPSNLQALLQGTTTAALPRILIESDWQFALYSTENDSISAWARCEFCQMLDEEISLIDLAKSTGWSLNSLETVQKNQQYLFLACLRVHHLERPIPLLEPLEALDKVGKFIGLAQAYKTNLFLPVLGDRIFANRKRQLENLEPPEHPEIEALHSTIAQLIPTYPNAIHLEQDLKCFLGWAESAIVDRAKLDQDWIQEVAKSGNSSDGDRFEKLVRRSFVELGFQNSLNNPKASLDPNAAGGAGGIDIYCDAPYSLVGECKASKHEKVPNSVSAQLIHLGQTHLGKAQFDCSIKVLFVVGRLTDAAEKAAVEGEMNVMRPETLERLVTLKTYYPGAINLFELKACLEVSPFGEDSDGKINRYLDRIQEDIEVRSKVVQLLQSRAPQDLGIETIWGAYEFSNPPRSLKQEQLKEILIELSSPLTGFVGRRDSNRFYFLRPFQ